MHIEHITLNEAATYESLYSNEDIIEKLGEVDVYDYEKKAYVKMQASDIIKVASDALYKIQRDYSYLYQFITKCKLMYLPTFPSEITNTMAVDNNNNLWMNFTFIYNDCKMDSEYVFGILFHEMFHIFFDHLLRFDKKFPKSMFASAGPGVYKRANTKANLCMDYEVNASMVEDGIVSSDFFKEIEGLYKKEYTGMTWEEILDKYGDKEYDEWLVKNGETLDSVEKQVLDAIEEAAKVLMDPESDEADKRFARKRLQEKLDKIFGKQDTGEKSLQDIFEDLGNTKLADHGEIAMDLEDVADDLMRHPENMTGAELDKTLMDIDKLMDAIEENSDAVAGDFNKTADEVHEDAEKARQALKDAMKKINGGGLSKDEKKELIDKAKDALEDILSDENEKDRLKEKRAERDAKKAAERMEKFKKAHPFRKWIIIMKNLRELYDFEISTTGAIARGVAAKMIKGRGSLISDKTDELLGKCIDDLEPLTEKKFSDMKKKDMKNLVDHLNGLYESLLPDLVKLIEDETILNKTEEDMQKILDDIFETVFNALNRIFDPGLDDDAKGSLIKAAAMKLRNIGKILKTQKKWRVGDDFKKGYIEEMKRLMQIRKDGGDEALFKELWDKDVINKDLLDDHSLEIFDKLIKAGEIKNKKGGLSSLFGGGDIEDSEIDSSTKEKIKKLWDKPTRYTDDINGDDEEDVWKPYDGIIYYNVWVNEDGEASIELSDKPDFLPDDVETYGPLGLKFEKDFPEYRIAELMEAVFEVCYIDTYDFVDPDELREKLAGNPDYKQGEWHEEE